MQDPNTDPNEIVRAIILSSLLPAGRLPGASHEECVEMRWQLIAVKDEDVPEVLGEILIDLLDTHTGHMEDSEGVECVIDYLDVHGATSGVVFEKYDEESIKTVTDDLARHGANQEMLELLRSLMRNGIDLDAFADLKKRHAEIAELFSRFSREQAFAIYKWLELVNDWDDLFFRKDEIISAMKYWGERAGCLENPR